MASGNSISSHSSFERDSSSPVQDIDNFFNQGRDIVLIAEYTSSELLDKMIKFKDGSLALENSHFGSESRKLQKKIKKFDDDLENRLGKKFSIDFIEHSHYIYAFHDRLRFLPQEDINLLNVRCQQFQQYDYPKEDIYKGLQRLLKFLSNLLFYWGLFDLNNYGYRYKGRSLTVKVIDMTKINEMCITADIFWFTYAIKHLPFVGKIDNAVLCYAEILQFEIDKIIEFLRNNDLSDLNFSIAPKWKIFSKNDPAVMCLYEMVKGLELSYRYFEKNLIQEFLKVV